MIKTACDSWKHQLVQCQLSYVKWRKFLGHFGKCWIFLLRFVSFVCFTCLRTLEDICEAANVCPPVQKCHHSYLGQALLHVLYREHSYSIYSYSYPYINLLPIRVTLIPGTSTSSTEARVLGETMHKHWILVYAILQQLNCNNIRYIYNAIHIQYTCTTHQAKQLLWGSERVSHLRL